MPDTVSKGIHENVYQVELGSNARVLNIETNTIESIDKGTLITIYAETIEYALKSFKFMQKTTPAACQIIQTDIDDGVIRTVTPKPKKQ